MPWFAPIVKKSSSAPLSQPQPYHHDHHQPNNPPPSAVARKIKEQGWYNSIKPKQSSAAPASHAPLTFVSTPLGVADSPLRARQPSSNPALPFLRSQKSRRPTTPPTLDDARASANPKVATLNKKNLQHHNDSITTPGPAPSAARIPSAVTTQPQSADEFGHFQSSVRSISGSTASHAKWKSTPLLSQHHHPSLLIHQAQATSPAAHDFEVATQSLAIRLQELATANQDGLLDDEEYRTLRQGLFDRMTANNNEPSVIDLSPIHYESFPNTASTIPSTLNEQQCPSPHLLDPSSTFPTPLSPTRPAPSLRRSLRSTASTTSFIQSLFKRQTRWLRAKTVTSDSEDGPFVEEPESSPTSPHLPSDAPPPLTRPLHHRPEIHGQTPASNLSSHVPSQGGCSQSMTSSTSAPSETSSSPARPKQTTNSSRSSSTYSKTGRMSNGPTTTTVIATADQPHTSATAMRREISDLEYERGRVLETFDEMERAAIVRWRGREGLVDNGEALLDSPQGRPQSFLAPLPGAATLRTGTRHGGRSRGMSAFSPPMEIEQSIESDELEKEIEEIRKKRKAVEDRYGDRLEYLNAKLKGAMIRERTKAR